MQFETGVNQIEHNILKLEFKIQVTGQLVER